MSSFLNETQKQAVSIKDGSALILAGAGSGKTTVISHRIFHLIGDGIFPSNILTLTFTNKAAKEMKERVTKMNRGNIKNLKILTFHSLGVYILKRYASLLGFNGDFNIYSTHDQKKIYHEIFKEVHIDLEDVDEKNIISQISLQKNNYIKWNQLNIESKSDLFLQTMYKKYQEKMHSYSAMDFDDLLYYVLELFENHQFVLDQCRSLFKYVMVDEYQDTNRAQYLIVKKICEKHGNLFVVGDDDQSIYGWRGADINNILNFKDDFPRAKIIKLEENYRSTNFILKAANSLIHNNLKRHDKNLYSQFEDGKKIHTFESAFPKEEAEMIANDILLKRLKYSINFNNFLVLFRTNSQSKIIEEVFKLNHVPFISSNQYELYERKEIKDIIAYMRILNNSDDDLSLLRIINVPKRNVTSKILKNLKKYSMSVEKNIYDSIEEFVETHDIGVEVSSSLITFKGIIDKHRQCFEEGPLFEKYLNFLLEIEFEKYIFLEEKDTEKAERRLNYIEQFNDIFKRYIKNQKNHSIGDFLHKLAIVLYGDKKDQIMEEDGVNLMTIHSAKGLEFDHVYIVGLEEGMLPFQREEEEINIDEERRLFYVGITRAKKELTLSLNVSRKRNSMDILSEPSRFLDEIDNSVIHRNYGVYLIKNQFEKEEEKEEKEDLVDKAFDQMKDIFKDY